ncbi:aromatic compound dioxygenase, partial [Rhizoctonia solani]
STCVTAPEVTEGPYYVANELLRTDLREDQAGVDLVLDIGVIDTTTCTPLEDALVEIWNCNATGSYAGFTSASLGAPPGNSHTWLRGGYATNSEGMVEFKTIYPGYYTSRTVHIHTMVQTNYSVATNGSIISHAGQVRHIGQIFFDEDLNDQVLAQPAYVNTTQIRTLNEGDSVLAEQNTDGYNAFAEAELLSSDVADGVLAYITLGVDTTHTSSIRSTNYVTLTSDENATKATEAA